MRVYLDRRLKLWLAIMGVLSLLFVHFTSKSPPAVRGVARDSVDLDSIEEIGMKSLVLVYKSPNQNGEHNRVVNNAQTYADSLGYDFEIVDQDWRKELMDLLPQYSKGVILVAGSQSGSLEDSVSLPLVAADKSNANQAHGKPVGLVFNSGDEAQVKFHCALDSTASPFEACKDVTSVLFLDLSGSKIVEVRPK